MTKSTRVTMAVAFLSILLASAVFGSGMFVKMKKDGADNPSWLNVTVTHNEGNLYNVVIHAKNRPEIAGYDLQLTVRNGELKGLRIPVRILKVKPGYTAGMALPKSLLSKASLTLSEHIGAEDGSWFADGGSMYEIDLGSYIPKTEEKDSNSKRLSVPLLSGH